MQKMPILHLAILIGFFGKNLHMSILGRPESHLCQFIAFILCAWCYIGKLAE